MKIFLYTQESGAGGSLRLLLNLATYLNKYHELSIALDLRRSGRRFLEEYPEIRVVSYDAAKLEADTSDVLLAHLPYGYDDILSCNTKRKLIVSMEVVKVHPVKINDDHLSAVDGILYLHPEQISHLGSELVQNKCFYMPLINNVASPPEFSKSGDIGCVGSKSKHRVRKILKILRATSSKRKVNIWSGSDIKFSPRRRFSIGRLKWKYYLASGRIIFKGIEPHIAAILSQYDLLLHTPSEGNGTSTVISDALGSGKLVLLTPIPAYKDAYGGLPGVYFLDEDGLDIEALLSNYDEKQSREIKTAYSVRYDRSSALKKWKAVIEGNMQ